ncbi:MAG TPA: hypothetical protein VN853_01435 [Polyangia bacterium]|nr:hypothetical protein [Polyangia bacterium]
MNTLGRLSSGLFEASFRQFPSAEVPVPRRKFPFGLNFSQLSDVKLLRHIRYATAASPISAIALPIQ